MSRMTHDEMGWDGTTCAQDLDPAELVELRDRLASQPTRVRAELAPLVEEALEHARFRASVLLIARDALERFRLDLSLLKLDLEATRREREALKAQLQD